MSEQENIQIARKTIDNFNKHDPDANDQYLANDVRVDAAGSTGSMNKEQTRMYYHQFFDAFPDIHFDLKDTIAQGDKVAVVWVAKGTHKAPLVTLTGQSIPATNRTVVTPGVTIVEFRNNMVVRQEIYWDQVAFLTQLGVLNPQELVSRAKR
jgi:steroid delta-isomerase-like uncharacterized protein